jgi:hypothetical protein
MLNIINFKGWNFVFDKDFDYFLNPLAKLIIQKRITFVFLEKF